MPALRATVAAARLQPCLTSCRASGITNPASRHERASSMSTPVSFASQASEALKPASSQRRSSSSPRPTASARTASRIGTPWAAHRRAAASERPCFSAQAISSGRKGAHRRTTSGLSPSPTASAVSESSSPVSRQPRSIGPDHRSGQQEERPLLSEDKNRLLCETGPGTPMGELLRRYWQPIAGLAEFERPGPRPVRIMGEDLVLYLDRAGTLGLVDRHCPHRRADLSYGFVEQCGLRCNYHGWLFDETGRCLDQPFEERAHPRARFKDKVAVKAYRVQARAGLVWAYLGPEPAPLLPDWARFHDRGYKQVALSHVPCNWFQCQENSIDPVHFEWLHSNWSAVLRGEEDSRAPTHTRLGFDEFDYGFVYRRVREDKTEDDELWTVGRVCLWPNCL